MNSCGITVFGDVTSRCCVSGYGRFEGTSGLRLHGCRVNLGSQWHSPRARNRLSYRCDTVKIGVDLSGSGYGTVTGCCEHGFEPTGYIKLANSLVGLEVLVGLSRRVLLLS